MATFSSYRAIAFNYTIAPLVYHITYLVRRTYFKGYYHNKSANLQPILFRIRKAPNKISVDRYSEIWMLNKCTMIICFTDSTCQNFSHNKKI